jgi:methanogenic corrinoid protein MtbC1
MYTIKHAAEVTGVPVATLRAWERRYGVVNPVRSDGGYRLYDEKSLGTIRAIRDLVAAGWSASQAAAEVVRSAASADFVAADASDAADAADAAGEDFVAAARDLDDARLAAILDDRFSRGSFESMADEWLMPALHSVGDAWAGGSLSVASEHLAANAVLRRLAGAFEAAFRVGLGPSVLVGLAPGSRHEFGALAFATAARRAGVVVGYLGADLPVESWVEAVERAAPNAIVLAVPRRQDVGPVAAVIEAVRGARPGVRVVVGGHYQDLVPPPAEALGHNVGDAASRLARELSAV